MCGIVYVKRLDGKPAAKMVRKSYEAQKTRGSDGFGYVTINSPARMLRFADEKPTFAALAKETAHEIIFHHRTPTSTANLAELAHPIVVDNAALTYRYYVVHNGIISNDDELRAKHETAGFVYTTLCRRYYEVGDMRYEMTSQFNDSEAFAIELARAIEGKQAQVDALGSSAFIALAVDKKTDRAVTLYYGRNEGNPLKLEKTPSYIAIRSEGNGQDVPTHTLNAYNYATGKTTETPMIIGSHITPIYSGGYSGYGFTAGGYSGYKGCSLADDDSDIVFDPDDNILGEAEYDHWAELQEELDQERDNLKYRRLTGNSEQEEIAKQRIMELEEIIKTYERKK